MADKQMEKFVLHQLETHMGRRQRAEALRYELERLADTPENHGESPSDTESAREHNLRKTTESGSQPTREEALAEYHSARQSVERLEHYVSLLAERERRVICCQYRDHMKIAEIAEEMEISVRTVSYIKKQAVARLCDMYSVVFGTGESCAK